jgi:hypothetical protein
MNSAGATRFDEVQHDVDVRREYCELPRDLAALTSSFEIALPAQMQRDAAILAFAIECADRLLDALPQASLRGRFSADVMSCLRGEDFSRDALGPELEGWLAQLREVAQRRQLRSAFCGIVHDLLRNSERMRTTTHHGRFIECAVREGRLMVELLLLILADVSTPPFDTFMRRLSAPANLIDKLRDAGRDFRRGEIALYPTLAFRIRLLYEILRRTFPLGISCASHGRLLHWGIRSLFTELIWFRFSKSHSH